MTIPAGQITVSVMLSPEQLVPESFDSSAVSADSSNREPDLENPVFLVSSEDHKTPIFSTLSTSGDRYQGIVLRFVDRLAQQINAIEQSLQDEDYSEMKDLGLWLKGSAGSVGFHDFDEPGQELELAASLADKAALERVVARISSLGSRVAAAYGGPIAEELPGDSAAGSKDSAPIAGLPDVVRSKMMGDSRFQPLIKKYLKRLPSQFATLDYAVGENDLEAVADWAHWLLGTAGTLGFNEFTEPAATLQRLARTGQSEGIDLQVRIIKILSDRIERNETGERV